MKKCLRNKEGFSLTEALVAIAVLALLLSSFAVMVNTGARMNAAALEEQRQLEAALTQLYTQPQQQDGALAVTVNGTEHQIPVTREQAGEEDVILYSFEGSGE